MSTINFSGYTWKVKSGQGVFPGPNNWDPDNVFVDSDGHLHLKICKQSGSWSCAEIYMSSDQRLGFGTYQWQILGRPDILDENVVLGLFNYTVPEIGPGGTNEIDIEFSAWGHAQRDRGNWTVWPAVQGVEHVTHEFDMSPNTDASTHRFDWQSRQIFYQSLHGLREPGDDEGLYASWPFAPSNYDEAIPQHPLPVHVNLWLNKGMPPQDGREVELVISSFNFDATLSLV